MASPFRILDVSFYPTRTPLLLSQSIGPTSFLTQAWLSQISVLAMNGQCYVSCFVGAELTIVDSYHCSARRMHVQRKQEGLVVSDARAICAWRVLDRA
jgi:hypothetical protein